MQKIIQQILNEDFNYESGSLDFSCAKIEISLHKGQVYEGEFQIRSSRGCFSNGVVISSDLRMECLTKEFTGSEEKILFRFHGETMEEGDVVKGNFYIISNQGEYYLPFVATMEHTVLESSIGIVRNLFHFTNLAKSNWQEALKLFYSPDFPIVFTGSDAQYADVYRALSAHEGVEQNMEEFLIQINKKQKVEFLTHEKELTLDIYPGAGGYPVMEKEISLVKNGWGYTRLEVECIGDFLFTEKERLTDDDFLGNRCVLPVFMDIGQCREGKNFGFVHLYNSYVDLRVPVTVHVNGATAGNARNISAKRCTLQIMELYQNFRNRKIHKTLWLKETGKLVEKLLVMNENDIAARLFQAQLLITQDSMNEAGWILDHVAEFLEKGEEDEAKLAYYLYLTTLIHGEPEYVKEVTEKVEYIYRRDKSNWRAAWLLLYLSEEYGKSPAGKWTFLEKQFENRCKSPVLYIEAVSLLNNQPTLLRRLGSYEIQVLWYGVRKELLNQEVVEQIIYLLDKVKEFSDLLYRILVKLYNKKNDVRLLQQICTLLIKGCRTDNRYFEWYKAGVENNLRITNLYEYYMVSMDLRSEQEIPKTVLMYFTYQNNLDYEHTACLYDYILQNEDRLGDIYETYRFRIEYFCMEQISKLHINRHLADIYNRLLQPEMITGEISRPLSRLLFAHAIKVEDDRLRKVFVYQPGSLSPREYALNGNKTWVPLYGNEYTIAFEDGWGNRFIKNVEYTIEKLMIPGKMLRALSGFPLDNPELALYLCQGEKENNLNQPECMNRVRSVIASEDTDCRIKHDLVMQLLQFYYDTDDMQALDAYLVRLNPEEFSAEERGKLIRLMILRGNLELAGQWLEKYGPYFIDVKQLVRLLAPLIEKKNMIEDEVLLASAVYTFRKGKYDSVILRYLTLYYKGMTRDLRDLWKAAVSFEVDCYNLCENILVQMLYTGAFVGEKMEIFRYYISQGAKPEVEDAFLAQCSMEYFVRDRVTDKYVIDEIMRMYTRGESVRRICKLAFLKYYAENSGEMDSVAVGQAVKIFLHELINEGIHLEFFKAYRDDELVLQEMSDKTIVEYHANPRAKVRIHYVIMHEDGEADEYVTENMKNVYGGVCVKEFILFFGESLQYYITELKDEDEQLTESNIIQKSDILSEGCGSMYHLINDIVFSRALQDYDTLDNLLEEYYRKEYFNSRLFELM
ncbi:MAG: DUF5717 family protein [Acetatifactor sp.]